MQRARTTSGPALHQLDDPLGAIDLGAVEGGHELVVGVERHLGDARIRPSGLLGIDAELGGQDHERGLGRVPHHRAVVGDRRVGVEREAERQPREVGHRSTGDRQDLAALAVTLALDAVPGVG